MATRRPPGRGGKFPPRKNRDSQESRGRGSRPRRPARPVEGGLERLNKVLARAGLGSRRAVEEYVLQGRVTVDGQVVRDLATKVDPDTVRIELDGEPVRLETFVYFAVNKPKGYVSTNDDPSGRPRVVDLLPGIPQRVYAVGRLDENSTGLMLLTNDGELANRLAHPRYGVEKVYHALVAGLPEPAVLDKLVEGVWLAEGKARARKARIIGRRGDATMLEIVLSEGKNREVRRMLAKLGHKVMSLTRVAVGPISVKGLKLGGYRPLTAREVGLLRQLAEGLPVPTAVSEPRYERDPGRERASRGTRGKARAEASPANRARGRVQAPPSSGPAPRRAGGAAGSARPGGRASGVGRPMGPAAGRPAGPAAGRPMGPAAGRPARPMGPRGGAGRPTGPRRPAARPQGGAGARPVVPLPGELPPSQRKIIGLPTHLREAEHGPEPRPGLAKRRPPRRAGGPSRPAGPRSARPSGPAPGTRRRASILKRPRRSRPGDEE